MTWSADGLDVLLQYQADESLRMTVTQGDETNVYILHGYLTEELFPEE